MKSTRFNFRINKTEDPEQRLPLLVLVIWIVTVVAQLGSLYYSTSAKGQNFQDVVFSSFIYLSLVTLPLAALGISAGKRLGLGAPLLSALLNKKQGAANILFRDVTVATILGIIAGAAMLLVRSITGPYLPPELPAYGYRGVTGGLLVSIGAAVGEEVWFRLGLLTIILWGLSRIFGFKNIRPSIAWPAITLVAILFGAAHLPHLISYGAGSAFAIYGTILGNSVVGILYGWCYWRLSLVGAITAHFATDLVIHVLPAFFIN